jgi:hypothetical protein
MIHVLSDLVMDCWQLCCVLAPGSADGYQTPRLELRLQ